MKKKLLYYWYVPEGEWYDVYDMHLGNLSLFNHVFDEKEFVISRDGESNDTPSIQRTIEAIKKVCPDAKFTFYENDKENRESKYFYHEVVRKLDTFDDDTAVFFAHNKGASTIYTSYVDCVLWITIMYYYNLASQARINDIFSNEKVCAVGAVKQLVEFEPHCSKRPQIIGTYFWFVPSRVKKYLEETGKEVPDWLDRYYAEGFWGALFDEDGERYVGIKEEKHENETFRRWLKRVAAPHELNELKMVYGNLFNLGNETSTDLFIFTHKPFETKRTNPVYKIVTSSDINMVSDTLPVIKFDCELSNIGFSEWQKIFEIFKRGNGLKEYVGIMHYHRYLKFSDDVNYVPDLDKLFEKYDVISKRPTFVGNMREQYASCHNVADYDIMMGIIEQRWPQMMGAVKECENRGALIDSNITIFRKDDFLAMCSFVFDVLFAYCDIVGINPSSDESFVNYMKDHHENYMKKHLPDDDEYLQQARICSYLAERLLMIFIYCSRKRICIYELTEE